MKIIDGKFYITLDGIDCPLISYLPGHGGEWARAAVNYKGSATLMGQQGEEGPWVLSTLVPTEDELRIVNEWTTGVRVQ